MKPTYALMSKQGLLIGASMFLIFCGPSAEGKAAFLSETESIPWTEKERLESGEGVCDYLNRFKREFHDPLGEPYSLAFDDLHRFAMNAGADISQTFDLNQSSVRYLCQYEPYVEAWETWIRTVELERVLNE